MQKTVGHAYSSSLAAQGQGDNFLAIRIVAASLVIYGHSFALAAADGSVDFFTRFVGYRYSGDIAVGIFFVLSGFLVCGSYDRLRSPLAFLRARAARLLPALLVCLCLSLLGGLLLTQLAADAYLLAKGTWRYVLRNATLIRNEFYLPGVFANNRYGPAVNGSLWTLPIEGRLYLLVALVGSLGLLAKRSVATAAIIAMSVLLLAYPERIAGGSDAVRLILFFAAGALIYLQRDNVPLDWRIMALLVVVTWLLRSSRYYEWSCSVSLAYAVFWFAYLPCLPLPRWLGDISYGTYLYGWPIQQLLAQADPELTSSGMTVAALPVTWGVAAFSWRYVEQPAIHYFKRRRSLAFAGAA